MQKYIIIVAGGSGTRMGSTTPKQFLELLGRPILMHTLHKFHKAVPEGKLIVVLPSKEQDAWQALCEKHAFELPHQVVDGGNSRFHSVQNGLKEVNTEGLVAIHDGVRPLVSEAVITNGLQAAAIHGAVVPTLPMQDSIRQLNASGSQIADRSQFVLVQTPQCFQSEIILKAYQQAYQNGFTDDASVVEQLGHPIHLIDGNKENIKITTPEDLKTAAAFLS